MNSKKAKQMRKEARKFSNNFGFKYSEIYKQLKKTTNRFNLKQEKNEN